MLMWPWRRSRALRESTSSDSGRTSIRPSTKTLPRVAERRATRAIIDTSVLIDVERIDRASAPEEVAFSAIAVAELAAAPQASSDPAERARRQDRLQRAEATFEAVSVGTNAVRAFGRIYAAVASGGRRARGRRAFDLLIAATALAEDVPLHTRNPRGFKDLTELVEIHAVEIADR